MHAPMAGRTERIRIATATRLVRRHGQIADAEGYAARRVLAAREADRDSEACRQPLSVAEWRLRVAPARVRFFCCKLRRTLAETAFLAPALYARHGHRPDRRWVVPGARWKNPR